MRVKLDPSAKVFLKNGILPRFFNCQPDRKRAFATPSRAYPEKLRRKQILSEINEELSSKPPFTDDIPETSEQFVHLSDTGCNNNINLSCTQLPESDFKSIGIQVKIRPHYRSVSVQVEPQAKNIACSSTMTSFCMQKSQSTTSSSTDLERESLDDSDEYVPSDTDLDSEILEQSKSDFQETCRRMRITRIFNRPKSFIGVSKEALFILSLLQEESGLKIDDIILTLEKIKHDQSFIILGDEYGMSSSSACNIFNKTVRILAHFMKHLVFWPSADTIKLALPIPFRARYNDIQSIIDCFEVEIQKPSNPIHQAMTWSNYKKCNTIKFLISSTPDGTINYISEGFGGRTSDALIVQHSGYLEYLPEGCSVMADRGFKHIEHLIIKKGCTLVRPPSVSGSEKQSKSEVLETKRIASLRIHIERVINRIREYALLSPHAALSLSFLRCIDDVAAIVGALINLQTPVIAQL